MECDSARPYTPEQLAIVERICAQGRGAHYEVLGVKASADLNEMKQAFKTLALQLHPDKNPAPAAEEAFKLLAEAWEVLSDPYRRSVYDRQRTFESSFNKFNHDRPPYRDAYEEPPIPTFRPRTPPPNETRKQRRQREYEERQALRKAKEEAERRQRQLERERRREARGDIYSWLDAIGVRFVRDQNGRVYIVMRD